MARYLSINDTKLGNLLKADRAENGVPDETGLLPLTAAERAELTAPRRKNTKLHRAGKPEEVGGLLRDGVDQVTRFTFIDRERAHQDVRTLCRLLGSSAQASTLG